MSEANLIFGKKSVC